jgi:hypothetical protein
VTGASQNLDLVPLQHVDHPFPRCLVQRVCDPKGSAQSGQNFRKDRRQNSGTRKAHMRRPSSFRWVIFAVADDYDDMSFTAEGSYRFARERSWCGVTAIPFYPIEVAYP